MTSKHIKDQTASELYVIYRCPHCKAFKGVLQASRNPLNIECTPCLLDHQKYVKMIQEKYFCTRKGTVSDMYDLFNNK